MSNQSRSSKLVLNAIANWVLFVFGALVGFFLSPFVVHHLGATGYGVWSLLAGLVGYFGLLDFGIRNAVSRYIAHHRAVKAHEESSSIVSAALRLYGFLIILVLLLSGVIAYLAPILFNIPEPLVTDSRIIVVLGGLSVAVSLIGGAFGGVVTGLERFDINCYLEIFVTTVRTIAIVLALREGYGLVSLACIHLAASIMYCVLFWATVHKLYPELHLRYRGPLFQQMRTILSFSMSLTVLTVFAQFIYYSDALVIGAFLPIESVTFFVIAGNLAFQASGVATSLANVMTPRVSALISVGSNRVGEEVLGVARVATLIMTPIAATFMLRGESFISLWMGSAYGPTSGEVLGILAIVVWLGASRVVVVHSLIGMGKQRALIPGFGVEAACNLALSLILIRQLGIVGVALGTLIPSVLLNLTFIPRCLSQATGVPISQFYGNAVLLPTLACIPFALTSVVIERFVPAANLAVFFMQMILILPLVLVAAWFLCLSSREKEYIGSVLRRIVGR
jgi:O-antigen/teichoic acid export membrane protein